MTWLEILNNLNVEKPLRGDKLFLSLKTLSVKVINFVTLGDERLSQLYSYQANLNSEWIKFEKSFTVEVNIYTLTLVFYNIYHCHKKTPQKVMLTYYESSFVYRLHVNFSTSKVIGFRERMIETLKKNFFPDLALWVRRSSPMKNK